MNDSWAVEVGQFPKTVKQYLPPYAMWFCYSHVKKWGVFLHPTWIWTGTVPSLIDMAEVTRYQSCPDSFHFLPLRSQSPHMIMLRPPWKAKPHGEMRWDVEKKKKRERSRSSGVPDMWGSYLGQPEQLNLQMAPASATNVCSFMTYSRQDCPAELSDPTEPGEIRINCCLKPLHLGDSLLGSSG